MRRSEHYTVPDKLYSLPEPGVYRQVFHELPLLQRIYLTIRTWFGDADISRIIRDHELDDIKRRLSGRDSPIVDTTIPALRDGFHSRVRPVAQQIATLKPVLAEVRGAGAGPFMREMLEKLDSQLFATLDAACVLPEALMTNPATTAADAKKAVHQDVLQTLEVHEKALRELLDPVWASIEALALLATVDFTALIPAENRTGIQIPLRPVKDQLVRLACTVDLCIRNKRPDAIKVATDEVARRLGKRFGAQDTIWKSIETLDKGVSLEDLVRLAADEPRLELAQLSTPFMWWQRFSAAWIERIDVQGPLLRYRSMVVEDILRNQFEVTEQVPMWIPPSLYQRSVGTLRRLSSAQRFRDTRTMVGALAREQSLMSAGERGRILEAHMELDKAYTRLEELTGIGESRGKIGDELRRLRQTDTSESVAGVHKMNVYSKHRPEMRAFLDQAIGALTTISGQFSRNRATLRKVLKSGTIRIDLGNEEVSPVEILDLISEVYARLAVALRGLVILEHELTRAVQSSGSEDQEADDESPANQ